MSQESRAAVDPVDETPSENHLEGPNTSKFVLPHEVLMQIFQHVDSNPELHLVCKLWYRAAVETPQNYSSLALKPGVSYAQYQGSMRFYRRVHGSSIHLESLTIPTAQTSSDFWAIIKDILHNDVTFKQLHITSTQFFGRAFFNILKKNNFKCLPKLSCLEVLTVMDNDTPFFNDMFIRLSPNLERFELISRTSDSLSDEEETKEYVDLKKATAKALGISDSRFDGCEVKSVTLITRWDDSVFEGDHDYTSIHLPSDDLIFKTLMSEIENLTLVGMYLPCMQYSFHEYLGYVKNLKHLYFEQNLMWFLPNFLKIMETPYYVRFFEIPLESLTFREISCGRAQDLDDFTPRDPPYRASYLTNIRKVDLYGSSLTSRGLRKFFSLCGDEILLLNLGNSKYLHFEGTLDDPMLWEDVLAKCTDLQELFLPCSHLNGQSLRLLNFAIDKILGVGNFHLKTLDLSFCDLDEESLLCFFESSMEQDSTNFPRVEKLVLDGISIPESTIVMLKKKGYAKNVVHDQQKSNWRVYGVNSYITEEIEYGDDFGWDDQWLDMFGYQPRPF